MYDDDDDRILFQQSSPFSVITLVSMQALCHVSPFTFKSIVVCGYYNPVSCFKAPNVVKIFNYKQLWAVNI